jgi:hypothetical protein
MGINVTAKSRVFVGLAFTGTPLLADYEATTWTEIGAITNLGSWGAKGKELTTTFLSDGYTRRLKGSIDNGTVQLVVDRDPLDEGQLSLRSLASSDWGNHLFKVELNDAQNEGGLNSIFYFSGPVMGAQNKFDGNDTIIETTFDLGISGQIIEVAATIVLTFTPAAGALPAATHAVPYTETILATGGFGTVTYAVTAGTLPSALVLNAATGAITGTPAAAGSATFTITATFSGAGEGSAAYTLAIG